MRHVASVAFGPLHELPSARHSASSASRMQQTFVPLQTRPLLPQKTSRAGNGEVGGGVGPEASGSFVEEGGTDVGGVASSIAIGSIDIVANDPHAVVASVARTSVSMDRRALTDRTRPLAIPKNAPDRMHPTSDARQCRPRARGRAEVDVPKREW